MNLVQTCKANTDLFMVGGALFGLGTTIFLAIKATPRAQEMIFAADEEIEAIRQEGEEKGWPEDIVQASINEVRIGLAKDLGILYAPTALSGLATGFCIVQANHIPRSQNAMLSSALNISSLAFQEYRDHVRSELGDSVDMQILDKVQETHILAAPTPPEPEIYNTGNGNTLCYVETTPNDPTTGVYFWSSPEAVHAAENDTNAFIVDSGACGFEDFLYFLKVRPKRAFWQGKIGWSEPVQWQDFSHIHPVLKYPVLAIRFLNPPRPDYLRYS